MFATDGSATADLGEPPDPISGLSLTAITPAVWSTSGNTQLTLQGHHFAAGATVRVAGQLSPQVSVVSSTRLLATLPPSVGSWGPVRVAVTNPSGETAVRSDLFSYSASKLAFPNPIYETGQLPQALTTVDLNGDQRLDVIVANEGSDSLSVFLGDGAGGFGQARTVSVGSGPVAMAVGDFNQDRHPDLAVANFGSNSITILLGDGSGNFAQAAALTGSAGLSSVVAADLDGNGIVDLAVLSQTNLVPLLGDGKAGFVPGSPIAFAAGTNMATMAVGDFNNDQRPDLVLGDRGNSRAGVLLGNGAGSFGPIAYVALTSRSSSLAVGDFDGDGNADAVVLTSDGLASVLQGTGTGTLVRKSAMAIPGSSCVAVADVNLDAKQDLVVLEASGNSLSVYFGNGVGGFALSSNGAFTTNRTVGVGIGPRAMSVTDLDGDGKVDVAVANSTSNEFRVLKGDGSSGFGGTGSFDTGSSPKGVTVADLNGDGILDLATVGATSPPQGRLFIGDGSGGFTGEVITLLGANALPEAIKAGDVNGDGRIDLVVTFYGSSTLSMLLNTGTNSLFDERSYGTDVGPRSLALGDMNGDGKLDIITANQTFGTVSMFLNVGDGTLGPRVDVYAGNQPFDIAAGDLNGDGLLDVAVPLSGAYNAVTFLGDGRGGLSADQTVPLSGLSPSVLVAQDLNGDDQLDLVVGTDSRKLNVLLGDGHGKFLAPRVFDLGTTPSAMVAVDLNGDQKLDLAIAESTNSVLLLQGDGGGGFTRAGRFAVGSHPTGIAAGDFNRDGRPDLVVMNNSDNSVRILLNKSQ
jgi:hypothetical protein